MNRADTLLAPLLLLPGLWTMIGLFAVLLVASVASSPGLAQRVLVQNGAPRSAIVVEEGASDFARLAVQELRYHIRRASGADLPVVNPAEAERLPSETVRIVIGPGPLAERLGVDVAGLEPEQYRITTVGNSVVFVGHDLGKLGPTTSSAVSASPATLWAVDHFLDRNLGVRWLWPGDAGTHIPEHKTIVVADLDVTARPALQHRKLRARGGGEEAIMWKYRHMMGSRSRYGFGHAFGRWWGKYQADHPEYFAVPPEGRKQPYPYRDAPEDLKLGSGIVLGMVHTYNAYDQWRRWHDAGAKLFLRPNWWHMGACAPHLPLHKAGEYFRFAHAHSMIGFDFDSLLGYWGTQGPYYYLIARLSARPDLTVDDVIGEYASAFGGAAPAIRSYLDYWEAYTDRAAYTVPAGGSVSQDHDGLYEHACRQHGLADHPLRGGWLVLPYLYTDSVLAEAESMLDEAHAAARDDDETVRARIQFLQDGLTHLRLTRDAVEMAYAEKPSQTELARKLKQLHELRDELTPRHVVWGDIVSGVMEGRNIKPEADADRLLNVEGI